jgi:hypothetical protein
MSAIRRHCNGCFQEKIPEAGSGSRLDFGDWNAQNSAIIKRETLLQSGSKNLALSRLLIDCYSLRRSEERGPARRSFSEAIVRLSTDCR